MTRLNIGTRRLAVAVALLLVPVLAHADEEALSKKDAPAGRSRVSPRPDGSALAGTPMDTAATPAPSGLGFGPMTGNPLFGSALPMKSGN